MFASVTHELRTPLSSIINTLRVLEEYAVDERSNKHLEICKAASLFLNSLVSDILDYAQMRAGKFRLNYDWVYVHDVVHKVMNITEIQLQFKESVKVMYKLAENLPEKIWSDHNRIMQVLINLVKNATKFTQEGHIRLTVRNKYLVYV